MVVAFWDTPMYSSRGFSAALNDSKQGIWPAPHCHEAKSIRRRGINNIEAGGKKRAASLLIKSFCSESKQEAAFRK